MAIKFDKVKPGMVLLDIHSTLIVEKQRLVACASLRARHDYLTDLRAARGDR